MTKRRTIGENPLDVVGQENSLDALVPTPQGTPKDRPGVEKTSPELSRRLAKVEAEAKALGIEVAQLKATVSGLQEALAHIQEPWLLRKLKDRLTGK
jgi:hypothetical protein